MFILFVVGIKKKKRIRKWKKKNIRPCKNKMIICIIKAFKWKDLIKYKKA